MQVEAALMLFMHFLISGTAFCNLFYIFVRMMYMKQAIKP